MRFEADPYSDVLIEETEMAKRTGNKSFVPHEDLTILNVVLDRNGDFRKSKIVEKDGDRNAGKHMHTAQKIKS
jgi:hypothetical protein